jgi:hypothetical protein
MVSGLLVVSEGDNFSAWDVVLLHEVFGKRLARFDFSSGFARAENRDADAFKMVNNTCR